MAYYSENLNMLYGKIESVPGTLETFADEDFNAKIFNPALSITIESDDEAAKYANGNHSEDIAVKGIQYGTITFQIKLAKTSSADEAPSYGKFLYGAGLSPVTYAGTGWSLQPLKSYDVKTLSLRFLKIQRGASPKAVAYDFAGCMGTVIISAANVGAPLLADFSFSGKLSNIDFNVSNDDILDINNLDTACYEKFLNGSVTIGGDSRLIDSFSLDTGNEISMLKDPSDSTGIKYFAITNRQPRFTCDPLVVEEGDTTYTDYQYLWGSATGCAPNPEVVLTTSNWTIDMPKTQLLSLGADGRDGLSKHDMTFKLLGNGYTGNVIDADLPYECTFELLKGSRS